MRLAWIVLLGWGALALGVAIYLFAPGPVGSRSLGYSVAEEVGGATVTAWEDPKCEVLGGEGEVWSCDVEDPSGSGGGTTYEVREKGWTWQGWSCWSAERTGPASVSETNFPPTAEGCVRISDSLRLGERLLDRL